MKGAEFITEEHSQEEIIGYCNTILTECQPFLQQCGRRWMWRGVRSQPDAFIHKEIRVANRKPKDTPGRLHKKFNAVFMKEHGAPFRNAMFSAGKPGAVDDYGRVYAVFPEGDFEFIWNPGVADLFGKWQETYEPSHRVGEMEMSRMARLTKAEDKFIKKYVTGEYMNTDLEMALSSGNEIMVRGSGYYGISRVVLEAHHDLITEMLYEK